VQFGGVGERVVAADGDQHVDLQRLDDGEDVIRRVDIAGVGVRPFFLTKSGTSAAFMRDGRVREECRIVPPERLMERTKSGVSAWRWAAVASRSSGSVSTGPAQPRRKPVTVQPRAWLR
jgi:hypothetical protein